MGMKEWVSFSGYASSVVHTKGPATRRSHVSDVIHYGYWNPPNANRQCSRWPHTNAWLQNRATPICWRHNYIHTGTPTLAHPQNLNHHGCAQEFRYAFRTPPKPEQKWIRPYRHPISQYWHDNSSAWMSATVAPYNISRLATNTPQAYKGDVRPTNRIIAVKAAKSRHITPLNSWQDHNHKLHLQYITNILHVGIQTAARSYR
jgi:hypothetical protein